MGSIIDFDESLASAILTMYHKSSISKEGKTMKQLLIGVTIVGGFILLMIGVNWAIKGPPKEMPSVCPVILREDKTWVEDGWELTNEFPPKQCIITARTK